MTDYCIGQGMIYVAFTGLRELKETGGIFDMGLFSSKQKEQEKFEEITPALRAKLDEFAERGNQFEEEERYE